MKKGPTIPKIKRYFKACENAGYQPTAVKMCYSGDVIMYFDSEILLETKTDEWSIQIEKS